jgi:hypothetical protein
LSVEGVESVSRLPHEIKRAFHMNNSLNGKKVRLLPPVKIRMVLKARFASLIRADTSRAGFWEACGYPEEREGEVIREWVKKFADKL